ncbi:MAG: hypothetical protein JST54_14275 [Deltaproteobacteria bacterium]|nr:hypothetical protein [Deltaproteobacteria bacterium]
MSCLRHPHTSPETATKCREREVNRILARAQYRVPFYEQRAFFPPMPTGSEQIPVLVFFDALARMPEA